MEMHRDLQSLGCKTEYLANNETELANILDTIIGRYDSHQLLFGETADALADLGSDVNIGVLRELSNSYPEKLAALNVFASKYSFQNTRTQNYHQIDEVEFQNKLAGEKETFYSQQNRISDAQSLAVVMRLRQSSNSYDLANSKYIFVTANTHLARASRVFVRQNLGKSPQYIPPVLTHSQISTAAWITNEIQITDNSISRDLLANCMSAQKLSKEWVDGFVDILKAAELDEGNNTIVHAVRSIARDESLGNPTILRKLNPNEIIRKAKESELVRAKSQKEKHEQEAAILAEETEATARAEEAKRIANENEARATKLADKVVRVFEIVLVLPCIYILVTGLGEIEDGNIVSFIRPVIFTLVTTIAVLDLFQFQPVRRMANPIRRATKNGIKRVFYE